MPQIILKPKKDKALRRRHPWVFSGAIARVQGQPQAGAIIDVRAHDGRWLAQAEYNPHSQIRARAFCWQPETRADAAFWRERLAAAIARRHAIPSLTRAQARRLVFAESDGLPGLIVDAYGPHLVIQLDGETVVDQIYVEHGGDEPAAYAYEYLPAQVGNHHLTVLLTDRSDQTEPTVIFDNDIVLQPRQIFPVIIKDATVTGGDPKRGKEIFFSNKFKAWNPTNRLVKRRYIASGFKNKKSLGS